MHSSNPQKRHPDPILDRFDVCVHGGGVGVQEGGYPPLPLRIVQNPYVQEVTPPLVYTTSGVVITYVSQPRSGR